MRARAPRSAIAAAAAGLLVVGRLGAQVEDLGSAAQDIVNQMRAQTSSAPALGGTQITFTPNASYNSAAAQQQLQRIAAAQTRQLAMNQMAGMAGQAAGMLLAQALFGSGDDAAAAAAARQAELQRQQQLEFEHQQRIQQAAAMKINWDGRDAAMEQDLESLLTDPASHSTDFFNASQHAPGPDAGVTDAPALISAPAGGVPVAGEGLTLGSPDATIAPEFQAAQRVRASVTPSEFPEFRIGRPVGPGPGPDWQGAASKWIVGRGLGYLQDRIKDSSLYNQFADGLKYVPGYDWAVKAKSAYGYVGQLRGEYDEFSRLGDANVTSLVAVVAANSSEVVSAMGPGGGLSSADVEAAEARANGAAAGILDRAGEGMQSAVKRGLQNAGSLDAQFAKVDEVKPPRYPSDGPASPEVRASVYHSTSGSDFNEAGYPNY